MRYERKRKREVNLWRGEEEDGGTSDGQGRRETGYRALCLKTLVFGTFASLLLGLMMIPENPFLSSSASLVRLTLFASLSPSGCCLERLP